MKKKNIDNGRRNFIKKSVTGLAAVSILPSVLKGNNGEQTGDPGKPGGEGAVKKRKMIYRTLGKTGIRLPIVSAGGRPADANLYRSALDAGLVHVDTANTYNNGNHETMLGTVLKGRPRDSFVIATKVHVSTDERTGLIKKGSTAGPFVEKFETSLKRLGLDYVDIFYMHGIARGEAALYEPILAAMQKLKKQGKTRFIGVSTHANEPEVIMAAAKSRVYDVVLTAYNFRQPHLKEVEAAIDFAAKAGLGIVAMKTQAGTFWDRERKRPINMKAALKWVLNNKNIHTAIPGFNTFDQMEADIAVMEDLALTPREKEDLMLGQKASIAGLYCAQCGKCLPRCRGNLDIPTLMRSFMYVYGHKNPAKAKQTLSTVELADSSALPCRSCGACTIKCTMGFDIKSRVMDIARIKDVPDAFLV